MTQMTERQSRDWPEAVAEAQGYVTTSTISADISSPHWRVTWSAESRPGRGHAMTATWCDGEYLVEINMDVYGYPCISVAEVSWIHNTSDEECPCAPCTKERALEE